MRATEPDASLAFAQVHAVSERTKFSTRRAIVHERYAVVFDATFWARRWRDLLLTYGEQVGHDATASAPVNGVTG